MSIPEPISMFVSHIAEKLGGEPGSNKWAVVTATFGWAAAVALIVAISLKFMGLEWLSSTIIGLFSCFFWIAFGMDWKVLSKKD